MHKDRKGNSFPLYCIHLLIILFDPCAQGFSVSVFAVEIEEIIHRSCLPEGEMPEAPGELVFFGIVEINPVRSAPALQWTMIGYSAESKTLSTRTSSSGFGNVCALIKTSKCRACSFVQALISSL